MPSEHTRQRSLSHLRRAYLLGRLSTDTFERRVECALGSDNTGEIDALSDGLPGGSVSRAGAGIKEALRSIGRPTRPPSLFQLSAKATMRVGRSSQCEIVLTNNSVSRVHAELLILEGRWHLRDMGSTNGTFVNGRRLRGQVELRRGDLLTFGDITARF